ncbi:hypothetical protein C8J55DRAFT_515683 [Lentinula edodes]|uniref:Uncharacterized protein n=1 Tax=Lentinula lateritia TaxID=40482 RepID=A0A9W9ACN4_9AGAR|nr:hypothetical protein C8J55DRAFT_515683 [Lentinula edodes]
MSYCLRPSKKGLRKQKKARSYQLISFLLSMCLPRHNPIAQNDNGKTQLETSLCKTEWYKSLSYSWKPSSGNHSNYPLLPSLPIAPPTIKHLTSTREMDAFTALASYFAASPLEDTQIETTSLPADEESGSGANSSCVIA